MMEYGCIGEHLSHSFSKDIHEKIGSYKYELKEIPREQLSEFFKERDFKGINVTIPYKYDVIPFLDEISDKARAIGAVNTIVNKNGRLFGDNTDFDGMSALILKNDVSLEGKTVAVLGGGGTSKTAVKVCEALGAKRIYRVSRTPGEFDISYGELYEKARDINVIINTTPCGMYPRLFESAVEISKFPELSGVFDAVYNPLRSKLVCDAKKLGIKTEGGLYMLVSQAVFAAERFFPGKTDLSLCDSIYKELFKKKENIVLTGMPGSGKTTVGKLVAEKTGKRFFDADELISEKAKMSVSDIFSVYGEKYFRELEAETLKELSSETGAVIATGGGAVLKEENIDCLKENGLVFFLNRDISEIVPTADRPLSSNYDDLKKRFDERFKLYVKSSDRIIGDFSSPELTALRIMENFYEDTCN